MRDRIQATLLAAVTMAAVILAATPPPAHAAGLKVAIIVGPTGSQTDAYRDDADAVYAAAVAAGANAVKVYSPYATWSAVKNAVAGANIIVWMGHGNGYPNPYSATENTDRVNGWGLNKVAGGGDNGDLETNMAYCGERALLGTLTASDDATRLTYCGGTANDGIHPAADFVMVYAHACYTAGAGEPGEATQTESTYLSRVKNFSTPPLRLGATAYYATTGAGASIVSSILGSPTTSFGDIFRANRNFTASALRTFSHADVPGNSIWLQNDGYHYAFAGNPNATPSNSNIAPPSGNVARLAGSDRYATAAAVSASTFAPGVSVAYVATGSNFPDALAGGAAAAHDGGPMLLVTRDTIPGATAAELTRLKPGQIVVLGGTGTVSDSVKSALNGYTDGSVRRIAGASRYETAALISQETFAAPVPVAYVATGSGFPDALAGVPVSGANGGPVLLVSPDGVPAATASELARLDPGRIVILGAAGVVSDAVATQLAGYAPVSRLAGSDRYATAVAISQASFAAASVVFVATGATFPDALGGGPVAGLSDGPLLLVPSSTLPSNVVTELQRLDPDRVVILGGTGVVSSSVASQIESVVGG